MTVVEAAITVPRRAARASAAGCGRRGCLAEGAAPQAAAAHKIAPLTGIRAVAAVWAVAFHVHYFARPAFPAFPEAIEGLSAGGYLGRGSVLRAERVRPLVSVPRHLRAVAPRPARALPRAALRVYPVRTSSRWRSRSASCGRAPARPRAGRARTHSPDRSSRTCCSCTPGASSIGSWNVPSWSISCEWLACLAFPSSRCASAGSAGGSRPLAVLAGFAFPIAGLRLLGSRRSTRTFTVGPSASRRVRRRVRALPLLPREARGVGPGLSPGRSWPEQPGQARGHRDVALRGSFALVLFSVLIVSLSLAARARAAAGDAARRLLRRGLVFALHDPRDRAARAQGRAADGAPLRRALARVRTGVLEVQVALVFAGRRSPTCSSSGPRASGCAAASTDRPGSLRSAWRGRIEGRRRHPGGAGSDRRRGAPLTAPGLDGPR